VPDEVIAEARNPDGRVILIHASSWNHVLDEHADMLDYLQETVDTIEATDHRESDQRPDPPVAVSVRIGQYEFDHATYDERGDVLYLRIGPSRPADRTYGTPEGHAVRFDERGEVIGITIVNAKRLSERDGKITVTFPDRIETSAEELAPALR
jgi:uncharacterized protein YuzE